MRRIEYESPFRPHINQIKILASKARFKVVKAGRRFGKTKVGIYWLILMAIAFPGELVYYVAPTYRMAKEIAWKELFEQLGPQMIVRKDERELWVEIPNGSRIALKGSDDPDHLRGRRLAALLMDEAAFQKNEVYTRILRPMCADLKAPVMFISSPKPGWFTQLFKVAKDSKDGTMEAWHFTIYDNPTIDRNEIDGIKKTTSDHIWRSEYLAEDVEFFGSVYGEFTDRNIYSPSTVGDLGGFPVVVGIDWGSDDPTGVAWLHFAPSGKIYWAKEHQRSGWDSGKHSEVIRIGSRGKNISKSDYVLSFDAFRRTAKDHSSIAEDFRGHLGFMPQPSIKDFDSGVDLVKRYLRGDDESPWLLVSADCPESINGFQNWEWNNHEPDIISAGRYALMHGIKRGYSKLGTLKKVNYQIGDMDITKTNAPTLPLKKSKSSRWQFDNNFGVPGLIS